MKIKDGRKPHFFWAHNAVFDKWGAILKANGIAVYLCLVRHVNNEGTCYPSFNTITKKCGVSRSTVVRTIDKLVELGLIKRERRNKSGSNNCDVNNGDQPIGERAPNENATNPPAAVEGLQVNSGEYELTFDFALKTFSPEQRRRTVEMLKSIPKADKQSVLDEFNDALSKNTVKSPWAYFNTLIRRYNAGEFTPTSDLAALRVETATSADDKDSCQYCKDTGQIRFMRQDGTFTEPLDCKHGQQARLYIQSVKKDYGYDFVSESDLPKNCPTIEDCPYCNERGMLDLRNRRNGKFDVRPCSHNPEKIKQLAREKDALIASAKPGYGDPPSISSKKRGGGFRRLADVISGLKVDDVPF